MTYCFRVFMSVAVVLALAAPALAGQDRAPLLTLVYTANTLGEFQACPVCGNHVEGGLGRRSTVFKQLRDEGRDRTLFIAGPHEFIPIVQRKPETPDLARALSQAYGMLGYDLGTVTPLERQWLDAAGASLPAAWQTLGSSPRTMEYVRSGVKVFVVLFPDVPMTGDASAVNATLRAVQAEALRAQARADLVVGVSPWGEAGERMILSVAPGAFDLLLGGGQGIGYGVQLPDGGRTLWVRPPFSGRGLTQFRIWDLPKRPERVWKQGNNFDAAVRMFDWNIPQDIFITNIFSWL